MSKPREGLQVFGSSWKNWGTSRFFTVDKGILKKTNLIGTMRVANPMDYVKEAE